MRRAEAGGGSVDSRGDQLPLDRATLEHLKPSSRGGSNDWDNLAVACFACNDERGNRYHVEGSALFTQRRSPGGAKVVWATYD